MNITFHGGDEMADVFVVDSEMPAGAILCSHVHNHSHLSCLVSGIADVTIEGETKRYEGRCYIHVPAGLHHKVFAVTDIVWLCLSANDEEQIDRALEPLEIMRY